MQLLLLNQNNPMILNCILYVCIERGELLSLEKIELKYI